MGSRSRQPQGQLSFLGAEFQAPLSKVLAAEYESARKLVEGLPPTLYFGTSSWAFPGWYGIVYSRRMSQPALAKDGLAEYARHPLLRTVGIDRGFYAPIPADDLDHYAAQLPPGYPCCTKAPALVTSPVHYEFTGGTPGTPNADFLSPGRFMEVMGRVFLEHFRANIGPFLFEVPPTRPEQRPSPEVFAERLDRFLAALPKGLPYAVELRDRALMTPAYQQVLAAHGVAHVYSYWRAMPMPLVQARAVPVDTASFIVIRLSLKPGTEYEERREAFAPFDKIKDPSEEMRREVVELIRRAEAAGRRCYVLVNNKAEGSSPLTARAIAERLQRAK